MAFFDKVLGNDKDQKLKEEIRSLELRKESVFSSINNEINQLENARDHIFLQAGMASYKAWSEAAQPIELEEYWKQVREIENKIAEQEAKKTEMGARYDEEISLISNNLTVNHVETGASRKCPKCGATVGESDVFCQKCGEKLGQAPVHVTSGKKCLNCGAECEADAAFCMSCGSKLG